MENRQRINTFLEQYGMNSRGINLDAVSLAFRQEMERGLAGTGGSLAMLPTYIRMGEKLPAQEKVIVIDAGGTNLRVATAWFEENGRPVIENLAFYKMPGTGSPIGRDEFYRTIAGYLEPLLSQSRKIGFCFSYLTEILPNRDGRLISLSKEVTVHGLAGDRIGENLLQTIKDLGHPESRSVVVLNDTVATLLGGASANASRAFDGYLGLVLGTGTNSCYVEKIGRIGKIRYGNPEDRMLVNIESGNFNLAPRGLVDEEVDRGTANPGDHVFEKMVSGAYLGRVFQHLLAHALADGLFSDMPAADWTGPEITARDLDEFLNYPYDPDRSLRLGLKRCGLDLREEDCQVLYHLIDALIERTAVLITANIAAVLEQTGAGANPCRPACIAADGSTFYKSKLFRDKLNYHVRTYLNEQKGLYCEFVKTENGNLIGTAAAGLQD